MLLEERRDTSIVPFLSSDRVIQTPHYQTLLQTPKYVCVSCVLVLIHSIPYNAHL